MYRCGDGEALVNYAYGESAPAEHAAITAHLARCVPCSDELAAIGSTREQLRSWVPPDLKLGFQITRAEGSEPEAARVPVPATVLRPAVWWNRPLPAWAQMAAAAAIFVAGMALGMTRTAPPPTGPAPAVVAAVPAAVAAAPPGVTRDELTRVEQKLSSEIAQLRTAGPAAGSTAATLQRVSQMIASSEKRQQQELDFRTSQIVSDVAARRKIDMLNIENRLGSTQLRVSGNQRDINSLAQRVNYNPTSSPYVP